LAIPDFQTLMRPLLELASDGKEHAIGEARERLAQIFNLTDDEKKALLPVASKLFLRTALRGREFTSAKLVLLRAHDEVTFGSQSVAASS
jgi:restriction endonuclease Mrr